MLLHSGKNKFQKLKQPGEISDAVRQSFNPTDSWNSTLLTER
jgi:hypothetical protein